MLGTLIDQSQNLYFIFSLGPSYRMTKTLTKTKTQTKCLKNPTYAHSKYDDRYLTLVILFTQVTLDTLFRSYSQFCRAECITVSGFSPMFLILVFFSVCAGHLDRPVPAPVVWLEEQQSPPLHFNLARLYSLYYGSCHFFYLACIFMFLLILLASSPPEFFLVSILCDKASL